MSSVWNNSASCKGLYTSDMSKNRNIACGALFSMFMVYLFSQLLYALKYADNQ